MSLFNQNIGNIDSALHNSLLLLPMAQLLVVFAFAASIGRVKFEVEASPALTPSWKSTSWSRPKRPGANAGGDAGGESPTLGDEAPTGEFDEALK